MDIGKIDRNLSKMQAAGASKEEMQQYFDLETRQAEVSDMPKPTEMMQAGGMPPQPGGGAMGTEIATATGQPVGMSGGFKEGGLEALQGAYESARPAIEATAIGVGAGGGGLLGAASPIPGGVAIGGALGYAGAVEFIDTLDTVFGLKEGGTLPQEAKEALDNVAEGAAFETLGPILGGAWKGTLAVAEKTKITQVFKFVKDLFPSMSNEARLVKARDLLKDLQKETPTTKKTTEETEALLKRTGVTEKPTFAQKTGSVEGAAFEQAKTAQEPELLAALTARDAKISEQGIGHIQKQFPGEETVETAVERITGKSAGLKSEAERLTGKTEDALATLKAATKEKEVIGEDIYAALDIAKGEAKKKHKGLYAKIPGETEVASKPITKTIDDVLADFEKKGGGEQSLPQSIIAQIKKQTKEGKLSFANLQDWRSQIGEDIRDNLAGQTPNLKRVRRLQMLKDGVDDTIDQMKDFGGAQAQIAKDYKAATAAYAKYAKTFRKGPVEKVLRPGYETTGMQTLKSDMPAKFFQSEKAELADDLISAIGSDKAKGLIKPYAETMFLTNATESGVLKQVTAQKWLEKHTTVLKKYGLYDDFAKIVESGKVSVAATKKLKDYQTTIVSTILKTDVNKLINKIFSGVGQTASKKTAEELLDIPGIKGNKAAIKGIQNSFKDFLMKKMEKSGTDVLGNPVRSIAASKKMLTEYMPAMQVLYKDSPAKIKAFKDYHAIMEMLARNKVVTYGKGSTTIEKTMGIDKLGAKEKTWGKMLESAATFAAVSHGAGWKWSAQKNFIKAFLQGPGKASKEEVDKILTMALLNPDAAATLMSITKDVPKKLIDQQIKYHMWAGAAISTKKALEVLDESVKENK